MAFSPHNDPLSLEYWIIGCVLEKLKGRMIGVFLGLIYTPIKGRQ